MKLALDSPDMLIFLSKRAQIETIYQAQLFTLIQEFDDCESGQMKDVLDLTTVLAKDHYSISKYLKAASTLKNAQFFASFFFNFTSPFSETHKYRLITRKIKFEEFIFVFKNVETERLIKMRKFQESLEKFEGVDCKRLVSNQALARDRYYEFMEENESVKSYDVDAAKRELIAQYRYSTIQLENYRFNQSILKQKATKISAAIKKDSYVNTKACFESLAKSLEIMASNMVETAKTFSQIVEDSKEVVFNEAIIEEHFPTLQPVFFQDFSTGFEMKDLLFGAPLAFTTRNISTTIPPFLTLAFAEIESRGRDKEGIYRVSPNAAQRELKRMEVERDLHSFEWGSCDIHVIASLVKSFFREMPTPLFPISLQDRYEYSLIEDPSARSQILEKRILLTISKPSHTVLKFFIHHLITMASFEETTKMGIDNLSLLFSAVLFESDPHSVWKKPAPSISESQSSRKTFGFLKKIVTSDSASMSSSASNRASDMMKYEHMKRDFVIPDMLENFQLLFPQISAADSTSIMSPSTASNLEDSYSLMSNSFRGSKDFAGSDDFIASTIEIPATSVTECKDILTIDIIRRKSILYDEIPPMSPLAADLIERAHLAEIEKLEQDLEMSCSSDSASIRSAASFRVSIESSKMLAWDLDVPSQVDPILRKKKSKFFRPLLSTAVVNRISGFRINGDVDSQDNSLDRKLSFKATLRRACSSTFGKREKDSCADKDIFALKSTGRLNRMTSLKKI